MPRTSGKCCCTSDQSATSAANTGIDASYVTRTASTSPGRHGAASTNVAWTIINASTAAFTSSLPGRKWLEAHEVRLPERIEQVAVLDVLAGQGAEADARR